MLWIDFTIYHTASGKSGVDRWVFVSNGQLARAIGNLAAGLGALYGRGMSRRIKFKKQYERITFGSPPSSRTVEGRRIADYKRAETKRINELMAASNKFETSRASPGD